MRLVAASNQRRAKAKFGSRLATLKRTLDLIAGQGGLNPAAAKAGTAKRAINDIKDFRDEAAVLRANYLLENVNELVGTLGNNLDDISSIVEDINAKYDVDVAALMSEE
ncbi:MAG: ABC-type transporter Mla subunit MlaD [Cognaticolwellia sp.]